MSAVSLGLNLNLVLRLCARLSDPAAPNDFREVPRFASAVLRQLAAELRLETPAPGATILQLVDGECIARELEALAEKTEALQVRRRRLLRLVSNRSD